MPNSLTLKEALNSLQTIMQNQDDLSTEALKSLVKNISLIDLTAGQDAITYVINENIGNLQASEMMEGISLSEGSNARLISRTDAAKFINTQDFLDAVKLALIKENPSLANDDTKLNEAVNDFLYNTSDGVYTTSSNEFIKKSSGSIQFITPNSNENTTDLVSQLLDDISNLKFTSVNRIQKENLVKIYNDLININGLSENESKYVISQYISCISCIDAAYITFYKGNISDKDNNEKIVVNQSIIGADISCLNGGIKREIPGDIGNTILVASELGLVTSEQVYKKYKDYFDDITSQYSNKEDEDLIEKIQNLNYLLMGIENYEYLKNNYPVLYKESYSNMHKSRSLSKIEVGVGAYETITDVIGVWKKGESIHDKIMVSSETVGNVIVYTSQGDYEAASKEMINGPLKFAIVKAGDVAYDKTVGAYFHGMAGAMLISGNIPGAIIAEVFNFALGELVSYENGKIADYLSEKIYGQFRVASRSTKDGWPIGDPLVLDLDGDGTESTDILRGTYFDIDNSGFKEKTAWISSDDGILAMDRNSDGKIDSGAELFGDQTILKDGTKAENGMQALAEWDENKDGKIDSIDSNFNNLRVWRDFNKDGVSSENELFTLNDLGITSFNLLYDNINTFDSNGNYISRSASYTKADGSISIMNEYLLSSNTSYSKPTDTVEVSNEIKLLPNLEGVGNVYSLWQTMARNQSGELKLLIENFKNQNNSNNRKNLIDNILFNWTGSNDIDPYSRGNNIDARKLAVLEKMLGSEFVGQYGNKPIYQSARILLEAYDDLANSIYYKLLYQTHIKDNLCNIFSWNESEEKINFNLNNIVKSIEQKLDTNENEGINLLADLYGYLKYTNIVSDSDITRIHQYFDSMEEYAWRIYSSGKNMINGTNKFDDIVKKYHDGDMAINGYGDDDRIFGGYGNDALKGSDGNDKLVGGSGDDSLFGDSGYDKLVGGYGNDLLDGGSESDYLEGGSGNDKYIFGRGYGVDTIYDEDISNDNIDKIILKKDISPTDLTFDRKGKNLEISIVGTNDKLIIKDYFIERSNIEEIIFFDGTIWNTEFIKSNLKIATEENDYIYLSDSGETINSLGGDDTIFGGKGDDIIEGGMGIDYLQGGAGNDTYIFSRGSGSDTIYDNSMYKENVDKVVLKDILPSDVTLTKKRNNLEISINGTFEKLMIKDYFINQSNIEEIVFSNETIWDFNNVNKMVLTPTEYDNFITLTSANDTINGLGGNDIIYGDNGNDIIDGGNGFDTLYGENGNDTLNGGSNRDVLYGGSGHDTLNGQDGDDVLEGGKGNDVLLGGDGDDILNGGYGEDIDHILNGLDGANILDGGSGNDILKGNNFGIETYKFGRGYGYDVIENASHNGTVLLNCGITTSDITIRQHDEDLQIIINDSSNDKLTIKKFFSISYLDPKKTETKLDNVIKQIKFADGTTWNTKTIISKIIENQTLSARPFHHTVKGGAGNDTLNGDFLGDTLDGGAGDDFLNGRQGSDTYIFGRGYGVDTICEEHSLTSLVKKDKIKFKNDIESSDILIYRCGLDLELRVNDSNDKIIIGDYYFDEFNNHYNIVFSDGTTWDNDYINSHVVTLGGTKGDDILIGTDGPDNLDGKEGNDTFDGKLGNDYMQGNGKFIFGRGYGVDTIYGSGLISFKDDIIPTDIILNRTNNKHDLELQIINTEDKIIITDYFYKMGFKIEFKDGTVWDSTYLQNHFISSTVCDDIIYGTGNSETIEGGFGDDNIHGFGGTDTLIGGPGDDEIWGEDSSELYGGSGNDELHGKGKLFGESGNDELYGSGTLDGGDGNDKLYGDSYNDTLIGGDGDDELYGRCGQDVLDGGLGNDYLKNLHHGRLGDGDVYKFGRGYGVDTIMDYDGYEEEEYSESEHLYDDYRDKIIFNNDVSPTDITIIKRWTEGKNDLELLINGTDDKLIVKEHFSDSNKSIELIEFSDGTIWDKKYLKEHSTVESYDKQKKLKNNIHELQGDNYKISNKKISADNIYTFDSYSQSSMINDKSGDDIIQTNVDMLNLVFSKNNDNLVIQNIEGSNNVTVTDWYTSPSNQIESIITDDGNCITNTQVQLLIENMAAFSSENNISWSQAMETGNVEAKNIVEQFWIPTNVNTY